MVSKGFSNAIASSPFSLLCRNTGKKHLREGRVQFGSWFKGVVTMEEKAWFEGAVTMVEKAGFKGAVTTVDKA